MKRLFSVIVPTFNRPAAIVRCATALSALEFPKDRYEVIVADDGSAQPVEPTLSGLRNSLCLRVVRHKNQGPAAARNLGAAHASGDYLVFLDDDCLPSPNWLTALKEEIAVNGDRIVGGRTENGLPESPYSTVSHLLSYHKYASYERGPASVEFLTSNNLLVPRAVFQAIEGFETAFKSPAYEDSEFCRRAHQRGHRIGYTHDAVVYHHRAMTLGSFLRQHFTYGRGAYHFYRGMEGGISGRVRRGLFRFYGGILKRAAGQATGSGKLWLTALVGASQAAGLAGYLAEGAGFRKRH